MILSNPFIYLYRFNCDPETPPAVFVVAASDCRVRTDQKGPTSTPSSPAAVVTSIVAMRGGKAKYDTWQILPLPLFALLY